MVTRPLFSVVTALKENSVLSNKLLSKSLYVHVLVTFMVTFGRSVAYQYCYCMLDCRRPYSPEKLILDPFFQEKEKVKDKIVGCDLFDLLCCILT